MNTVHKTFQMRGYCSAAGYDRIREALAMSATLYNAAVQERRDAWKMNQKSISVYDQMKQLTLVRQDLPEWKELDVKVGRGPLIRADRAFKAFFRRLKKGEKPGYPRFKPRSRYCTIELAEALPGMVKNTPNGKVLLRIKGLPRIALRPSRTLPEEGLKGIHITLRNRRLTVDLVYTVEVKALPESAVAVGIDLGVNQRLTLSDGKIFEGVRCDRSKTRRLQQAVSRARKGSNNRRKKAARLASARYGDRITNRNQCHRITTELVRDYGLIAVEALRVPKMVRSARGTVAEPGTNVAAKSGLNRSIQEQTWGLILQQLTYKAEWAGRSYIEVDPKNTSRTCNQCHTLAPQQQEYRIFQCPECGLEIDRDLNAAINILKRSEERTLRVLNRNGCAQEDAMTVQP